MKWLSVVAMLGACTRPSEDRAYEELGVGIAEIAACNTKCSSRASALAAESP